MRRIPIRHLKIDSVSATDVYGSDFRILVTKGTKIDKEILDKLKEHNIISLYILDEYSPKYIEDVVNPALRMKAVKELKSMAYELMAIELNKRYEVVRLENVDKLENTLNEIIDELLSHKVQVIEQIDIRNKENSRYSHSVNVAIVSIIIGIKFNFNRKKLLQLGLAALLHDIGKIFIPKDILDKERDITKEEEEIVKKHCRLGYDYLSKYVNISTVVKVPILNHHENIDGSGYPQQLKGKYLDEFTKIIALVNFYDNLISSEYMHEDNLPNNVIELIMSKVESSFDFEIIKVLFNNTMPFLQGTIVRLSNNDVAVVMGTIQGIPLRPIVKIIKSNNITTINKCINLAEKLDVAIVEILYYLD
ncbi:HD domain-containing phosphohydrolase [uncultured Clostridium sp.]|uniref:HD-GYP domain-containing protein n=1 Tax=uncultured Clostridium sp. TaxID=59620 RepID=UPI0025D16FC4|nr:HD domain-containing phosphohydrolase [uncultured Clostridium sp.]